MTTKQLSQYELRSVSDAIDDVLRGKTDPCISIEGMGTINLGYRKIIVNDLTEGQYEALSLVSMMHPTHRPCPVRGAEFLYSAPNQQGEVSDYFQHRYPPNDRLTIFKCDRDGSMDFMGMNEEYLFTAGLTEGIGFFGTESDMEFAGFVASRMNCHLAMRRIKTFGDYYRGPVPLEGGTMGERMIAHAINEFQLSKYADDAELAEQVLKLALDRLGAAVPYTTFSDGKKTLRGLWVNHDCALVDGKMQFSKAGIIWREPTLD